MPDYKRMVRREIFRLRSTVTDDVLFTSDEFREYLQGVADAAVGRTDRCVRVHMLPSEDRDTAYTNGEDVYINTSSPLLMAAEDRVERYMLILGAMVHETGHILFTDFRTQKKHMCSLTDGIWFPSPPALAGGEEIITAMEDPTFSSLMLSILARIRNIAEDIYVEHRLERHFSGLFIEGLHKVALALLDQSAYLEDQMSSGDWTELEILLSQLLQKARYGRMKARDPEAAGRTAMAGTLRSMEPYMEKLRTETDPLERCSLINELLVLAFPYAGRALLKGEADEAAGRIAREAGGLMPEGDSSPAEWEPDTGTGRPDPVGSAADMEDTVLRTMAETGTEAVHALALKSEAAAIMGKLRSETSERLKKGVSGESRAKMLEYRKSHCVSPSSAVIHRPSPASPGAAAVYASCLADVSALTARTVRLIDSALEERRKEGRESGFTSGRHIAPRSLCRPDGRIFSRSSIPDGKPDMAVCLLVDESGSMYMDGRIGAAMRAAVLLDEVLRKTLDISSFSIIGHSADLDPSRITLDLFVYKDFDDTDDRNRLRLADIQARAQNRDGDAVRYCCERLLARAEKRKLLLVITDGVPLALEYGGTEAERELSFTAEEYRRKGVGIFAASIGDRDTGRAVSGIYGSSWTMDCADLSSLPARLASLLRRLISRT